MLTSEIPSSLNKAGMNAKKKNNESGRVISTIGHGDIKLGRSWTSSDQSRTPSFHKITLKPVFCSTFRSINSEYYFEKTIGEGAHGIVSFCIHRETSQVKACKTIMKSKLQSNVDIESVRMEIEALRKLQRFGGVIRLEEVFEDSLVEIKVAVSKLERSF